MNFYQIESDAVAQYFKTVISTGLSSQDARDRLEVFGYNEIPHKRLTSVLVILLNQFLNPLMAILVLAIVASLLMGEYKDFVVILIAAMANAIVGFIQEYKAERAVFTLKAYESQFCNVRRDGKTCTINSKILVPGDIILLSAGNRVPADIRIVKALNLKFDESILTGESKSIDKNSDVLAEKRIVAEQRNMALAGTFVVSGKAEGIVVATGVQSYLGQIAGLVTQTEEGSTPLQAQILHLSWLLSVLMVSVSTFVLIIGFYQGIELNRIVSIAIALAVASVPEGLFVTVTAILAIGMQRMLKRRALVRHLVAAETLGSVSVICTDKTGTLTEGKMLVSDAVTSTGEIFSINYLNKIESKDLKNLVVFSILNNDANLQNGVLFKGNQTDFAILELAQHLNIDVGDIRKKSKRIAEIPFSSDLKYMVTLNKYGSLNKLIVKGAPEKVFDFCKQDTELLKFKGIADFMVKQGLRVIALATKDTDQNSIPDVLVDFEFCGLLGIKDPLRPQAKQTVKELLGAGINLVVVTGDHRDTAMRVASEAGLSISDQNVITGIQLDDMSDKELASRIGSVNIFARVEPKHKIRIVNAFKSIGKAVAMIGDGVNDAPALKAADIGVALGSGSDVAHEIADMVLLDNNLSSISAAVREGRIIFDNIRKMVVFLMTRSFSEVIMIAGSIACGFPLPLFATQIFWINMIGHGFTHLALIKEPEEGDTMRMAPRDKDEPILNHDMKIMIFLIGLITDLGLFGMYIVLLRMSFPIDHIRTIIFTALACDSLLYVFAVKSFRKSIFEINIFDNLWLIGAVILGFVLQLSALYVPFLKQLFQVTPLSAIEWGIILGLSMIKIVGIEFSKRWLCFKN